MEAPRTQVFNLAWALDSHINTVCNHPQLINKTESIKTLTKLKRVIFNYDVIIDELVMLENDEDREVQRLPLSCALVVSQQIDDMIANCLVTYCDYEGIPAARLNSRMETSKLIEAIVRTTNNVKAILRKYSTVATSCQ